mgnify:CR=1 FL=1
MLEVLTAFFAKDHPDLGQALDQVIMESAEDSLLRENWGKRKDLIHRVQETFSDLLGELSNHQIESNFSFEKINLKLRGLVEKFDETWWLSNDLSKKITSNELRSVQKRLEGQSYEEGLQGNDSIFDVIGSRDLSVAIQKKN